MKMHDGSPHPLLGADSVVSETHHKLILSLILQGLDVKGIANHFNMPPKRIAHIIDCDDFKAMAAKAGDNHVRMAQAMFKEQALELSRLALEALRVNLAAGNMESVKVVIRDIAKLGGEAAATQNTALIVQLPGGAQAMEKSAEAIEVEQAMPPIETLTMDGDISDE